MVSLSTEICQNFNRFSLPSLYHKERTNLIIFFPFSVQCCPQDNFYRHPSTAVLWVETEVCFIPRFWITWGKSSQTLCGDHVLIVSLINGYVLKDKYQNLSQILILSNSPNQMIVQAKKRKVQWNNSCKSVGFTLNTTDTDSNNIQEDVRMLQCTEPQIVLM